MSFRPAVHQAGVLVREVFTDTQREELVATVSGHLLAGVHGDVVQRAFQYWKNIDQHTGERIEAAYHAATGAPDAGKEADAARADAEQGGLVETTTHAG